MRPYDFWPRRNVLSRFAGYVEPCVPREIQTIPSGYTELITGVGVVSPLSSNQAATTALLPTGGPVPASHGQYIPTNTVSGTVGGGLFGPGPIGYRVAYHERLEAVLVNGFIVYRSLYQGFALLGADGAPLFGDDGDSLISLEG